MLPELIFLNAPNYFSTSHYTPYALIIPILPPTTPQSTPPLIIFRSPGWQKRTSHFLASGLLGTNTSIEKHRYILISIAGLIAALCSPELVGKQKMLFSVEQTHLGFEFLLGLGLDLDPITLSYIHLLL